MSPVVVAVVVGAITTLGKWANGKTISIDTVVGIVGVAVGLAVLDQINKDLSKAMGILVVVGVTVAHGETLFNAVTTMSKNTGTLEKKS